MQQLSKNQYTTLSTDCRWLFSLTYPTLIYFHSLLFMTTICGNKLSDEQKVYMCRNKSQYNVFRHSLGRPHSALQFSSFTYYYIRHSGYRKKIHVFSLFAREKKQKNNAEYPVFLVRKWVRSASLYSDPAKICINNRITSKNLEIIKC